MYSSPSQSRLAALAAAIIVILSTITTQINVDAFQIISRRQPHTSSSKIDMSSFQEARLAEQLRFRISQGKQREELAAAAAAEEARTLLALEELSYEQLTDEEGKYMPEAPMMTYQKYLTMQEKRVKVTIRYSASAGLRPFYLTVADKIKNYHPDVLLERRILPKVGDSGEQGAIFEVLVDGKVIVGKKKTMFLKVRTSSGSSSPNKDKGDDEGKRRENLSGEVNFAGGRSISISMEKLEQELVKARKKRRPSTLYKNKEDALRATSGGSDTINTIAVNGGVEGNQQQLEIDQRGQAMTDAVMRLEKLKAMSATNKKL
mmetsp:Transcript_38052/g.77722  ORF Transcript_38052/g.77722 Transcript_38052/m.77722 type:complete len:318 (+) Transcript_38052:131-1084(+)